MYILPLLGIWFSPIHIVHLYEDKSSISEILNLAANFAWGVDLTEALLLFLFLFYYFYFILLFLFLFFYFLFFILLFLFLPCQFFL